MNKVIRELKDKKNSSCSALGEIMDLKFFSKDSKILPEVLALAKKLDNINEINHKSFYIHSLKEKIENSSLSELIQLMKCKYEIVRTFAAQSLIDSKPKNLFKMIEQLLGDKSENLRLSCIDALNYLSSVEALYLFEKSINDKSVKVRLKTVTGLADIALTSRNSKAISLLNSALFDSHRKVREYAIDELGLIGNEDSFKNLMAISPKSSLREQDLIKESLELLVSKATSTQLSS